MKSVLLVAAVAVVFILGVVIGWGITDAPVKIQDTQYPELVLIKKG